MADRTQEGQRLIESRELLELFNSDWTGLVWPTGRTTAFGPLWTNTRGPRHYDLMLNSDCSAFEHYYEPESGHLGNSAHAWLEYRTHPVSISDVSDHVRNTAT